MTITLQDVSIRDLDVLVNIERQCFVEEAFTKKQIKLLLTDYNSIGLVARQSDEIVGFIIGVICGDDKTTNGHIFTIDVLPSHRRKGIGQMLMIEIERLFAAKGAIASSLEVREGNVAALSLYHKLGYQVLGRLENYYGKAHGVFLKKILG
jgi:ribosomal-protein-alanine N-acetyltransferase